jgi:hypothetical protein
VAVDADDQGDPGPAVTNEQRPCPDGWR